MNNNGLLERRPSRAEKIAVVAFSAFFLFIVVSLIPVSPKDLETHYCPQSEIIVPDSSFESATRFFTDEYREYSVRKLSGAIQIPTITYDDMGDVDEDDRFDIFYKMQEYIEKEFPLSVKHGKMEVVGKHGLLFTFKGSEKRLRPVLFMAHQDVVPVANATLDDWKYPPFSGYYDGEYIYGRGAGDTKNSLIAMLEATESLVAQNWKPKRGLILSFGFDEEIWGARGARLLALELEKRYGRDSMEIIIDEGLGLEQYYGSTVAVPAVAQKGLLDLIITLNTPGGHSSMPPDHTGIGIMAQVARALEANPLRPSVEDNHPTLRLFQCLAEHSRTMDKEFRRTVLDIESGNHRQRFIEALSGNRALAATIRTTQALNVFQGGVKINALPEKVTLSINYRISVDSNVEAIVDRAESIVSEIANKFDLGVYSDGDELFTGKNGDFNINIKTARNPSAIAPAEGLPWKWVAGTTRHVFEESAGNHTVNAPVVVAPGLIPANTDTIHYSALTRAIYQYTPMFAEDMINYHTVDERLRFRSHLTSVAWYYEFVINTTV